MSSGTDQHVLRVTAYHHGELVVLAPNDLISHVRRTHNRGAQVAKRWVVPMRRAAGRAKALLSSLGCTVDSDPPHSMTRKNLTSTCMERGDPYLSATCSPAYGCSYDKLLVQHIETTPRAARAKNADDNRRMHAQSTCAKGVIFIRFLCSCHISAQTR